LGFDGREYIRSIFGGYGVQAQSPFVPATFGYDPAYRTPMSEYDPVRARALLDTFGYLDRDRDGWRETPQGSALTLEISSTNTQRDRSVNELWTKYLGALGLRSRFRIAQWPELVKQSMAGKLMIWGYAWQVGQPDSETIFGMGYGPNTESINDARFNLPLYNSLFERQRVLPDGPERLALLRNASRVMTAYMPYLLHMHRIYVDLAQPSVVGYRRHPFSTRDWLWIDVDTSALRRQV